MSESFDRPSLFVLSRLSAFSGFFAVLSLLLHFDAFFACDGLLAPFASMPLLVSSEFLGYLLLLLLCASLFLSLSLIPQTVSNYWHAAFFLLLTLVYQFVNNFGGWDLFYRDYDNLLLETTTLLSAFLFFPERKENTTLFAQLCSFVLFRYLYTLIGTAVFSLKTRPCPSLLDGSYFLSSHTLQEPSPLTFYLRFHSTSETAQLVSRILTSLLLLGTLLLAPSQVVFPPALRHGALRAILFLPVGTAYVLLQSTAWTVPLLVGLAVAAMGQSGYDNEFLFPREMLENWGFTTVMNLGGEESSGKGDDPRRRSKKDAATTPPVSTSQTTTSIEEPYSFISSYWAFFGLLLVATLVAVYSPLTALPFAVEDVRHFFFVPLFFLVAATHGFYILGIILSSKKPGKCVSFISVLHLVLASSGFYRDFVDVPSSSLIGLPSYGRDFFCTPSARSAAAVQDNLTDQAEVVSTQTDSLSRDYTGGKKSSASAEGEAFRRFFVLAQTDGRRINKIPLAHLTQEEEQRPSVGLQPLAHRVEMQLHGISASSTGGEKYPPWVLEFVRSVVQKRPCFDTFLKDAKAFVLAAK